MKFSLQLYPFPLLTPLGLAALSTSLLIPLAGFFGNFELASLLGAFAFFLALSLTLLAKSYFDTRALLPRLAFDLQLPSQLNSGKEGEIVFFITARDLPNPLELRLRPELPLESVLRPSEDIIHFNRGNSQARCVFSFTPLSRGERTWHFLTCRLMPQYAFCHWQFLVLFTPPHSVVVFPQDDFGNEQSLQALQRLHVGESTIDASRGEGREFESLRQYSFGDDLRRVDWKRSARAKNLLIKVYRPETHQHIQIALDCGRRMSNRVVAQGSDISRTKLEYATDAAARLLRLAHSAEDQVGLFAFSAQILARLPSRRGTAHLLAVREALRGLPLDPVESDYQLLSEWAGHQSRRSLLLLITSISNPAGLESIGRTLLPLRKRHLPLVFAVSDPDLNQLIELPAVDLTEAFTIAAAQEQILQIEHHAQILKRSGIDCIYCDAAALPQMMERKYVELKLSGRL